MTRMNWLTRASSVMLWERHCLHALYESNESNESLIYLLCDPIVQSIPNAIPRGVGQSQSCELWEHTTECHNSEFTSHNVLKCAVLMLIVIMLAFVAFVAFQSTTKHNIYFIVEKNVFKNWWLRRTDELSGVESSWAQLSRRFSCERDCN